MANPVRTISFKRQTHQQAAAIVEDPRDIDQYSYLPGRRCRSTWMTRLAANEIASPGPLLHVRAVGRLLEESALKECDQGDPARWTVESPEALRLPRRQHEAGHLTVFSLDSLSHLSNCRGYPYLAGAREATSF